MAKMQRGIVGDISGQLDLSGGYDNYNFSPVNYDKATFQLLSPDLQQSLLNYDNLWLRHLLPHHWLLHHNRSSLSHHHRSTLRHHHCITLGNHHLLHL